MSALNPDPIFFKAENIPVGPAPTPSVLDRFVDGLMAEQDETVKRMPMPARPELDPEHPYAIRQLLADHPPTGYQARDDFVARTLGFLSCSDLLDEAAREEARFGAPADYESARLAAAAAKLASRSAEAKEIAHRIDRERADLHAGIMHIEIQIEQFAAELKAAPSRGEDLLKAAVDAVKDSLNSADGARLGQIRISELVSYRERVALLPNVIAGLRAQLEGLRCRAETLAQAGIRSRASWFHKLIH